MINRTKERGVALVTTVIVVAVLAVVAVAFMQSTMLDRTSSRSGANYFRAQLAAEAGVAAGMARLSESITQGRSGSEQWNYLSGQLLVDEAAPNAEASTVAFISQVNSQNGGILSTNLLVSSPSGGTSPETVTIPVAEGEAEPRYPAGWVYINTTNSAGTVIGSSRYAFWVSDDTTKLNPRVSGTAAGRDFSSDPSSIPILLRDRPTASAASSRLASAQLAPLSTTSMTPGLRLWNNQNLVRRDSLVLSPQTARLLADSGNVPEQSLENDLALETLSAPVAPNGRPKVNLTRLKAYLDSLPRSQSSGNLRAQAVNDILDAGRTDAHARWGGGDLSFLLNPAVMGGKYTAQEARQFVANLFDAIDEDFIPTTDDSANPTVLGTEMRFVNGQLQGHPVLVYAGTGHFAGTPNPRGNSRIRTHLALGFANPWPSPSERWNQYGLELSVTPSDPLFPTLTTANAEELNNSPSSVSGGPLPARSGFLFPCRAANAPHYSAFVDAPFNRQVTGLTFTVGRADLFYNSSDGGRYLVARLPGSPVLAASPSTIPAGGDGINRTAWQNNRQAYWLRSDFRLSPNAANWVISPNGAGGSSTGLIPGPVAAIPYMSSADQGDGAQGLIGRINAGANSADNSQWYRTSSITNHLNLDGSLSYNNGTTRIRSTGFLGFINSGKPWQTMTLHAQNANNPSGREDWKILDYVYAGDEANAANEVVFADMGTGAIHGPNGARAAFPGVFARDGSLNIHTPNRNSWRAALNGVVSDSEGLAEQLAAIGPEAVTTNTFDFLREVNLGSGATTDFARERPLRYIADMLTRRSRNFTVYAVGQALAPLLPSQAPRVLSTCHYRGRVRVGYDTNTAGVSLRLIQSTTY
jgi:hypothetical protein